MKIYTVWANRSHDPDEIELVTAWDEYCVDANPAGFMDDVQKSLHSWGSDLHEFRHVEIEVDFKAVANAFQAPVVEGRVV